MRVDYDEIIDRKDEKIKYLQAELDQIKATNAYGLLSKNHDLQAEIKRLRGHLFAIVTWCRCENSPAYCEKKHCACVLKEVDEALSPQDGGKP